MSNTRFLPFVAGMILSFFLFHVSPADSFQISIMPPGLSSSMTVRNNRFCSNHRCLPSEKLSQPQLSSIVLKSAQDNSDGDIGGGGSLDAGGILGTIASVVVLYSEFVLKTTGCGLPAGPFGIVGAVEGVSYLGVVATCATAAVDYFSENGVEGSDNITRRIATALGVTAAAVGIVVLVLQVTNYGYIPNAVPMEGGMCK
jgi:hypothetical protein